MHTHKGTIRLETSRLILRRFVADDAAAAFRNCTGSAKVTQYLSWPPHEKLETTHAILNEWIKCYSANDFYQWAIVLKEAAEEPIGTISVVEENDELSMAGSGYCVGGTWWNRGIISGALAAVIQFLF